MTGFSQTSIALAAPRHLNRHRNVQPNLGKPFLGHPRLQRQHGVFVSMDGHEDVIVVKELNEEKVSMDGHEDVIVVKELNEEKVSMDGHEVVIVVMET
jgi:hypothetical protein